MREIFPGVYAPTMKSDAPAPSSKALRYVNSYTDARFEAWERSREEAELALKADLSAYEAQREALQLTIELAAKQAQEARAAAQAYREGGLKTLEGAAEFKANAANRQELFNTSEINDAAQFVANERNAAAQFSVGEQNAAARSAANRAARAGSGPVAPKGLDEKAVESLVDGVGFTSAQGATPYATVKGTFDTNDAQANRGALTRDRQPYSAEQQTYVDAQTIARQRREGKLTDASIQAILDDPNTDPYTADRLERALAAAPGTPGSGGEPGKVVGAGGVGAQGYSPEGAQLQGMDVDPILAEQARLAAMQDEQALAAERRLQDAQALLAQLGYPEVDLLARQRQVYAEKFTSGGGAVERLYGALLAEEQAKGLVGKAAEKSARKRLIAGDRPGNRFDDPTLPDNLPARDRTTGPGVTEVIDLAGDPVADSGEYETLDLTGDPSLSMEEDVDPRILGSSASPDDFEFAPTDLSMIEQAPSGLAGVDREALLALLGNDPTEDYLAAGGRLGAPEEPEPTPQEVDQAAKIEALLEARTLAKKGNKLRRLTETTEEGRTARDLVRANKTLERPQPLESLRKKIAETFAQDPAKQRRGVVLLYAQDMADKNAKRQTPVAEADPVIALDGEE